MTDQPTTPTVIATNVPAPDPVAHTEAVTVHAIPEQPTPQQHASRWHSLLSALEGLLAIGTSPEVTRLLPTRFQGYIAAASVVQQVAEAASNPQAAPPTGAQP